VKARDLIFGIATLVVAVLYYGLAAAIPPSELADPIGPQGLPRTYAVLLAALSLLLIARSVRRPASNPEPSNPEPPNPPIPNPRSPIPRVTGMLLIGIAYILVLPWLGYFLSITALIAVTIHFQGGSFNARSILVALSGAALFWLLFIWLLRIQYPAGIWPSVI
jgi:putative tricarboxylic transport membrane protein